MSTGDIAYVYKVFILNLIIILLYKPNNFIYLNKFPLKIMDADRYISMCYCIMYIWGKVYIADQWDHLDAWRCDYENKYIFIQ